MASQVAVDDNSNTKSEEGTMAFHKKRARRVSFAENTSVHIFDRDEDSGTPLDTKPPSSPSERDNEPNQLFWNVGDDDNDNDDEDDMDEPRSRSPFLRLVASPSSGGSTIGSATSKDEDNFFGPVSASFIRRDLLDSEASDVNHDHTMDSTAFSMHFRSIARSDSEVEPKASTGVHLSFEEQTPTQDSIPTTKPSYQPSVSTSRISTCSESNDMSIVEGYHYKYDYGELSPTLDALLAEGSKDLNVFASSNVSILKSPRNAETTKENGMDFSYDEGNVLVGIITHEKVNEVNGLGVANDGSKFSPSKQIVFSASSNTFDTQTSKPLPTTSSIMVSPTAKTQEPVKDAFQAKSSLDFSATSQGSPDPKNAICNLDGVIRKEHKSPFLGSVISLTDKPSHMLLDGTSPSKSPWAVTPCNDLSVFVRTENLKHEGSVSSIQKSISKLRMLEASPFSAALNAKLEDSTSRSLVIPSKMTPLNALLEKNDKDEAETLDTYLEGQLSSASRKKRGRANSTNIDDITLETPKNVVKVASPLSMQPESTRAGEKMQTNFLSSADIRNGYKDNKSKMGLSQNFDYSPQKKLKIVESFEFKGSPWRDAKQFDEHHEEVMGNREVFLHEAYCNSERKKNSTTLSEDKEHEKLQTSFIESDVSMGGVKTPSLVTHETTDKQSCQKNSHDQFCQSPSNKQPYNVSHDDDTGISMTQHALKHPAEIHARLSKETKQLLCQSVDKFNLHAIDRLVVILDQLQRSKTYQLFSAEIQSQNGPDVNNNNILHKRAAETKLILCKFVHEQAKLQLVHVKRDKLLKRAQSLSFRIQESELLKLNFRPQRSPDVHFESSDNTKDVQQSQIDSDKVASMGQTLDDIDRRISNVTKSFHMSCKMKGDAGSAQTIKFVNNYLIKRARCQIIRKDLQLWTVSNLDSRNGCHNVVLNYLDLMTQRLTVNAGPVPSISVSHELNDVNISKIFKDMNACIAFRFIFSTGITQKHVGAINLAQITQVSGSCLGNLLDVAEEVQHARIELKNLIFTRFHTPFAEQLDLELCFFDSKSRRKATVTLNTSCLQRGIYPSQIVPYQIEPQTSSSPSLVAEITAAVEDLRVGYSRIRRLCRCISQLFGPSIR